MGQETPPGANPLAQPWVGVVKLPTLRPQLAIVLTLYPSLEAYVRSLTTGVPQPMTDAEAPFMSYQLWEGRIVDNALSGVDARYMRQTASGGVGEGWTVNLRRGCVVDGLAGGTSGAPADISCPDGGGPGSLTLGFPELRQYSVLQISHEATVGWVLAAAILIVLGLLPALYVSRRKIWVRARPGSAGGSVLQVGGFALQRQDRFDEEFSTLVEAIVLAAGGARDDARQEVPSP
jgi:cytochrome c biogenesis protein ResB